MTLCDIAPFADGLGTPLSDVPRRGHWYDVDSDTVYADTDWLAALGGPGSAPALRKSALSLSIVLADTVSRSLERELTPAERFTAAGAIARTFLPTAVSGDAETVRSDLDALASSLETLDAPAGAERAALPSPAARGAAAAMFARGYADPSLESLETVEWRGKLGPDSRHPVSDD